MISGDTYGILNRLLLNQPIEPSPEGLLRLMGFVHVYSASGLHLLALESFLGRFFGKTLLTKKILTVCFWIFLILIWKLQAFRLGFARVLILFFLRALARVKGYRWRVYYPLFFAFCFDFALGIDSGWKHYYLAILGGMLGLELAKDRNVFLQHLFLSVASWMMTAPLDLFEHHLISWMTPIWSMITIPVIALFLYPLSVFSYFLIDRIPEWLMHLWTTGAEILFKVVDHGFTFSVVGDGFWWSLGIAIVLACLFLFLKGMLEKLFLLVGVVLLILIFRSPSVTAKIVQLDVGQGDSLLVQKSGRVEMIDLGTSREVKPESVLLHLARYGITHVDAVLFSHLDEDHAGGVRLLLPWVPIDHLEVNLKLERTSKVREWLENFPKTTWCEKDCIHLASVDWIDSRSKSGSRAGILSGAGGNDLMATAIIPLSSREVYLALGDSDSKQESIFWTRHHVEVESYPIRFLKVSHHGSKYSSSGDFLREVNPIRAIISAGRHNHYHHPHFSVVNELKNERIPIHRTDQDGDFMLESSMNTGSL